MRKALVESRKAQFPASAHTSPQKDAVTYYFANDVNFAPVVLPPLIKMSQSASCEEGKIRATMQVGAGHFPSVLPEFSGVCSVVYIIDHNKACVNWIASILRECKKAPSLTEFINVLRQMHNEDAKKPERNQKSCQDFDTQLAAEKKKLGKYHYAFSEARFREVQAAANELVVDFVLMDLTDSQRVEALGRFFHEQNLEFMLLNSSNIVDYDTFKQVVRNLQHLPAHPQALWVSSETQNCHDDPSYYSPRYRVATNTEFFDRYLAEDYVPYYNVERGEGIARQRENLNRVSRVISSQLNLAFVPPRFAKTPGTVTACFLAFDPSTPPGLTGLYKHLLHERTDLLSDMALAKLVKSAGRNYLPNIAEQQLVKQRKETFPGKGYITPPDSITYYFANDLGISDVLQKLTVMASNSAFQSKQGPHRKLRVAMVVGPSYLLTLLPKLKPICDLVVVVDINKPCINWLSAMVNELLTSKGLQAFLTAIEKKHNDDAKLPERHQKHQDFGERLRVEMDELKSEHYASSDANFHEAKQAAEELPVDYLAMDLRDPKKVRQFATLLKENFAELVFANFTNLADYGFFKEILQQILPLPFHPQALLVSAETQNIPGQAGDLAPHFRTFKGIREFASHYSEGYTPFYSDKSAGLKGIQEKVDQCSDLIHQYFDLRQVRFIIKARDESKTGYSVWFEPNFDSTEIGEQVGKLFQVLLSPNISIFYEKKHAEKLPKAIVVTGQFYGLPLREAGKNFLKSIDPDIVSYFKRLLREHFEGAATTVPEAGAPRPK